MNCIRCGTPLARGAAECRGCGLPVVFMNRGGDPAADVVEPEVLESLDEVERTRFTPGAPARHVGCALGPGCGCIGLPLLALAGVFVSLLVGLLWILTLGRVPISLMQMASRARRGFTRPS
jgi:hypothetical protein